MSEHPKKRGRPREFDPAVALTGAAQAFLQHGYSGASLETLTKAMNVNKPSLYAAFGDKRALFLRVLEERARMVATRYRIAFERGQTLEESLRHMFEEAVQVSFGEGGPPGCPIGAAEATESLLDAEIHAFTKRYRAESDKGMARWIRSRLPGEGATSSEALARLTTGILHDLALRARVGEPRAKLLEIARDAARVLAQAGGEHG